MANRERGEVSRTIGGTSYTFVLDMAAMIAAETEASRQAGKDVTWDQFWSQVVRGSARAAVVFVWAMLLRHHPDLSVEAVVQLIDEAGGVVGLQAVFEQGATSASPDPEDVKELGVSKKAKGRPRKAQTAGGTGAASSAPAVDAD